jgi:hypothetical protein
MKDRTQMTRTCIACGIEKPLAAFLEISSTHGTRYGSLCATCRGAGITEKKPNKAEEDQSTSATSGTRIGLKERVFIEQTQNKLIDRAKQQRIEQLNKRDTLQEEKKAKTNLKEKSEKDHRTTYLDVKKQPGFLNRAFPGAKGLPTQNVLPAQGKREPGKLAVDEKQQTIDSRQEETKKTPNLATQYVDPKGESWGYSPAFLAFQDSLEVTPFKLIREQLKKLKSPDASKTTENISKKDPLQDFVEKTWGGPSTTRRR